MMDSSNTYENSSDTENNIYLHLLNEYEFAHHKKKDKYCFTCSCFQLKEFYLWWFFHNDLGVVYDNEFYKHAYCSCLGCCPECFVFRYSSCVTAEKKDAAHPIYLLCVCCSFVLE